MSQRKSIFVTGAGSGIGRAAALLFAKRGWFVGLFDVSPKGLEETVASIPADQRIQVVFDVRDRAGWARAIEAFGQATGGKMDVLFNNAGVGKGGPLDAMTPEDIELVLDVNLKGVINGAVAALPLLRETPGACILNTASVAGIVGGPGMSVYCASKFGVRGLTESLSVEYGEYGVRVMSLMPWFVDTAILDGSPAGPQGNRRVRDRLHEGNVPIYPVSMAADRVWDAVHSNGKEIHFMVGKEAERARFAARFFPNAMRSRLKRDLGR